MNACTCTTTGHCAACQPQREAQWKAPTGYIREKVDALAHWAGRLDPIHTRPHDFEEVRFLAECIVAEANRWLGDESEVAV